jgi:dCTP deaminase
LFALPIPHWYNAGVVSQLGIDFGESCIGFRLLLDGAGQNFHSNNTGGALTHMSIKPDHWIEKLVREYRMIEPFEPEQKKEGVVSYGLSSYGYDIRVADEFKVFTNVNTTVVDPKNFDDASFVEFKGKVCTIPPNSFALARTIEYFRIPRNVLTICVGKSTYARCGIIVNVTPFEPEWEGFATLEISNTTPLPARIYSNEGIAQVLFFQADEVCRVSYADKKGRYQKQTGITLPQINQDQ